MSLYFTGLKCHNEKSMRTYNRCNNHVLSDSIPSMAIMICESFTLPCCTDHVKNSLQY